jgi:hypothetical protein
MYTFTTKSKSITTVNGPVSNLWVFILLSKNILCTILLLLMKL